MHITLEIKNLNDWAILLPLLKRLKIKVVDKSAITENKVSTPVSPDSPITEDGIMQFAEILSDEELATFETAIKESRKKTSDFFKSAGLLKDTIIDANTLRQKAWNLNK